MFLCVCFLGSNPCYPFFSLFQNPSSISKDFQAPISPIHLWQVKFSFPYISNLFSYHFISLNWEDPFIITVIRRVLYWVGHTHKCQAISCGVSVQLVQLYHRFMFFFFREQSIETVSYCLPINNYPILSLFQVNVDSLSLTTDRREWAFWTARSSTLRRKVRSRALRSRKVLARSSMSQKGRLSREPQAPPPIVYFQLYPASLGVPGGLVHLISPIKWPGWRWGSCFPDSASRHRHR